MKKILLAFDGSPGSEAALLDMARAGLPGQSKVKVFTVADVWLPPEDLAEPVFPERTPASRSEAREHALDAVAAARQNSLRGAERLRLLFPDWSIQQDSRADSPAWGILGEARRWSADLIVIGSHGRSPLHKFFLGSVSYKVAAEAHCSVRIFRGDKESRKTAPRIMVALDGSEDSEGAFGEVLGRAWAADTEFHLATVIDARLKATAIMDVGVAPGAELRGSAEEWVPGMLARHAQELQRRGFRAGTQLLEGDPKPALLHHAQKWNADCLFLGARGMQHGSRLYLGTVASAIISRAHCTVEIVRPANGAGGTAAG